MKKLAIAASTYVLLCLFIVATVVLGGCGKYVSSTAKESVQQEKIYEEAAAQLGMPSIKNFQEKRLLKQILELRDQTSLVTYTYIVAEYTGKPVYLGQSIGYGIPAATQYTNPQKTDYHNSNYGIVLPQADPNGLYSPGTAEGTWVLLKNPTAQMLNLSI